MTLLQVFNIELVAKSPELVFDPPLSILEDIVERLIMIIVESAQKLPRVEHVLFPDLYGFDMLLPAVDFTDEVVLATKAEAALLVSFNYPGAKKYVIFFFHWETFRYRIKELISDSPVKPVNYASLYKQTTSL